MKNENKIINKGGVGFCGLLTIVLIGLKVAGVTVLGIQPYDIISNINNITIN